MWAFWESLVFFFLINLANLTNDLCYITKVIHKNFTTYYHVAMQYVFLNVRAFESRKVIIFYFTILKSYFINYIIQFYNIPNRPTFIFLFYSLKENILPTKII